MKKYLTCRAALPTLELENQTIRSGKAIRMIQGLENCRTRAEQRGVSVDASDTAVCMATLMFSDPLDTQPHESMPGVMICIQTISSLSTPIT